MSVVDIVISILPCVSCFESERVVVITKSPLCNHIHDK